MNKIRLDASIRYREEKSRECARYAAGYAKEQKFADASKWYAAADFHAAMAIELKGAR